MYSRRVSAMRKRMAQQRLALVVVALPYPIITKKARQPWISS